MESLLRCPSDGDLSQKDGSQTHHEPTVRGDGGEISRPGRVVHGIRHPRTYSPAGFNEQ